MGRYCDDGSNWLSPEWSPDGIIRYSVIIFVIRLLISANFKRQLFCPSFLSVDFKRQSFCRSRANSFSNSSVIASVVCVGQL